MGDRYVFFRKCTECGEELECCYAESCGFETVTCNKCGTLFKIIQEFSLKKTTAEELQEEADMFGEQPYDTMDECDD